MPFTDWSQINSCRAMWGMSSDWLKYYRILSKSQLSVNNWNTLLKCNVREVNEWFLTYPTMSFIYLLYLICVAVHVFLPEITLAHRCNNKKWSSEVFMVTIFFHQHLSEVVHIPQLDLPYLEVGRRISESWHREGEHTYKPREVDMLILNTPCIIILFSI